MSSAICFNLDQSKILSFVNGLNGGVFFISILNVQEAGEPTADAFFYPEHFLFINASEQSKLDHFQC